MPQIITTNQTASASYTVTTSVDSDFIFIAAGVLVSNTSPVSLAYSAIGVFNDNTRIGIAGTLMTGASPAIYSLNANNIINVTATGSIVSLANISWDCVDFRAVGAQVFNDGSITSAFRAVNSTFGDLIVFNTGLISGVALGVGGAARVENLGTIRGATAVAMGSGNDVLINHGSLVGNVTLGDGKDLFDGIGGTVTGTVDGGAEDDVYRLSDPLVQVLELAGAGLDRVEATVSWDLGTAAEVEDLTLLGSATNGGGNVLNNMITGNGMNNRLLGHAGLDTIYGGDGIDWVDGGSEDDQQYGGQGDDRVTGRAGADTLYGGSDDDLILGGSGGDRLYGDDGDDVLVGGAGRDVLFGGLDVDTFQFRLVLDSGVGAALRDQIVAFEAGVDVVDLKLVDANSAVNGNQAFTWIGTALFGAVAGQLRLVTGVNSILQGDVTGDGVADFEVQMNGVATVSVNDLIL